MKSLTNVKSHDGAVFSKIEKFQWLFQFLITINMSYNCRLLIVYYSVQILTNVSQTMVGVNLNATTSKVATCVAATRRIRLRTAAVSLKMSMLWHERLYERLDV